MPFHISLVQTFDISGQGSPINTKLCTQECEGVTFLQPGLDEVVFTDELSDLHYLVSGFADTCYGSRRGMLLSLAARGHCFHGLLGTLQRTVQVYQWNDFDVCDFPHWKLRHYAVKLL